MVMGFSIENETKSRLPSLPFRQIKNAALGEDYDLTLIIASSARLKKLNTIYRDKRKATDILSFPITETSGEIYVSLSETKKEASKFERTFENFLAFLFIHGCVHLKGYDHGSTMERIEARLRQSFGV